MPDEELKAWLPRHAAARAALDDRDIAGEGVAAELETGLGLLGATAIEDKLQDGVGDCIETLRSAGVRVWVLTGDKLVGIVFRVWEVSGNPNTSHVVDC